MEENKNQESFEQEARKSASEFKESWNQSINENRENKKLIAGILAILLGGIGMHKFILGYTKEGLIHIIISIFTLGIGGIIGLIEGIIYLTKSDEEFFQTYQVNKRPWF